MRRVCTNRVWRSLRRAVSPLNEAVPSFCFRRSQTEMVADSILIQKSVNGNINQMRRYQASPWIGAQRAEDTSTSTWDVGHPPTDEKHRGRGERERGSQVSPSIGKTRSDMNNQEIPPEVESASADTLSDNQLSSDPKSESDHIANTPFNASEAVSGGELKDEQCLRMIPEDEGASVWALGIRVRLRCPGEMTKGSFSLLEFHVAPGNGSATHTHTRESETWYMLDGLMQWMLGDKTFNASKGSFIFLPKGVPHAFHNTSDKPATMLVSCIPSGFEKFFLEIGTLVDPGTKKPELTEEVADLVTEVSKKYGIAFEIR